ncbi:NUDIX domain-containing protein [bacterium]|nr:NUDIX domain-containing protein [bacterium]
MNREYPQYPILAVSATIFNSDKAVLLIQRNQLPDKGKWTLPGGVVQLGESPENALKRELLEECAVKVAIRQLNCVSSRIFYDLKNQIQYHYVILNYICDLINGNILISSDASGYQWVLHNDMDKLNLTSGIDKIISEALKKRGERK